VIRLEAHREMLTGHVFRFAKNAEGDILAWLHTPLWHHDDLAPVIYLNPWGR
jgi:hypothetical protein